MEDVDKFRIYSVAVDPTFCPQCGTELTTRPFDAGEYLWCSPCEMVFARNPLSAAHVIIRDGDQVLVLDEPIPQHEGVWSLPGGHAHPDESPRETAVRELEEETGLRADPAELTFVTIYPAHTEEVSYHFATYTLDRTHTSGTLQPETAAFDIEILPVDEVLTATDRIRDSDQERIRLAFDTA